MSANKREVDKLEEWLGEINFLKQEGVVFSWEEKEKLLNLLKSGLDIVSTLPVNNCDRTQSESKVNTSKGISIL